MSLLYKKESDLKYQVEVKTFPDGKVVLQFSADCGKFGTDETLDEYEFTVKELLRILQNNAAIQRLPILATSPHSRNSK